MKKFNIDKYGFNKLVSNLFEVDNLTKLHKLRNDLLPIEHLNLYTESSTEFHNIFYSKLNDNWIEFDELYDNFIHIWINTFLFYIIVNEKTNYTITVYFVQ